MLMRGLLGTIATAFALIGSDTQAREWPSVGGWDIVETDNNCGIALDYEGDGATELIVGLRVDGKVTLSLTNFNWSAKEGSEYRLTYYLNGNGYGGGISLGYESEGRKGFVTAFDDGFLSDFATSKNLVVRTEDDTLIDQLSLNGSAAALTQGKKCLAHIKAVASAEAREKARLAHIPKDPFATIGVPALASPIGSPSFWVTSDDYPSSALRAAAEGSAHYKLEIGTDGRVTTCTIISSSGNAALDDATCRLLSRRARFNPAKDKSGSAVIGSYEESVTWALPK